MKVSCAPNDPIIEDVNCDSTFMLETVDRIGKSIRHKMNWVDPDKPIYLFQDNAGGHGTKVAIKEYCKQLLEKYTIIVIHQCPRSPETNVLDLGIWCTLQWGVDAYMRGKMHDIDALNEGVNKVWDDVNMERAFNGVWGRLTRVVHLIDKEKGGNATVELMRGKKGQDLDVAYRWDPDAADADGDAAAPAVPVAAAPNHGLTPDQILEMLEDLPEDAEFNLPAEVDDDDEAEADEDMEDVDFGVI